MSDDTNFTQLSVPLARTSQNYAPKSPLVNLLRDKKPSKNPTKFEAAFKAWYTAKLNYEQSTWQNLYATAQLVSLYRQGEFLLQRRPAAYGGGYYVRPNTGDDTYKKLAMNMMMFHSQVCEAKIIASNPSVNMRAGDDTPQAIAAAQACRPIVDCYETEWYTNKWARREALDFLTNGMIIGEVRWNPFKGGQSVQSRQVNQIQKQTDGGYGECAVCQFTGEASDFGEDEKCPECGEVADVKPPSILTLPQISMGQSVPVGEPELIRSPLQGWRWELSKDLEDSPWAIKRQRITQGAINLMIGGDVIIPDSQSSDDYGLQILHALSYMGQAYGGTALAFDTPIATPTGWKEIWELGKGDQVFDEKGQICNVTFNSGIATERPCYEVEFSDGSVIVADENHLWKTFTYNERARFNAGTVEWRLHRRERRKDRRKANGGKRPDNTKRKLEELLSGDLVPSGKVRTTKQLLETLMVGGKRQPRFNHGIETTAPLQLPETDLPIDPYHFGLWLGDGNSDGGGYTSNDPELVAAFATKYKIVKRAQQYRYYVYDLRGHLVRLNVFKNKHIPILYLRSSVEQRLALLQGLMDTDGHCDMAARCEFSTTNPKLRDDFAELLSSLGIKFSFRYKPPASRVFPSGKTYNCAEAWRICFLTELPAFRLPRKLERQRSSYLRRHKWRTIVDIRPVDSVPVCCIGVDSKSHLYLAGETMIPTHNSSRGMYGGGNRDNDHRPTMAECYLSPEDCAEIDVDETETICGQPIPKGKLSDFAQGKPVCVVALNDGQAIVGVYRDENHQSQVYTGQWIMQSESGAGRGMEDTAAVAQRFNAADGQIYQGLASTATPAAITDMSLFKEDQANYLFRPGVNIDVNLALLPPNMKLSDAFYVPNAGNVNQQYINYSSQFLRQMAQITSFATEFTDGLVGVDNRTATGAQITAALANSLYAPMLGTKGQTRVRIAQMIVALVSKHSVGGRYYAGRGNAKGRMVSAQDLKGNVVFELVQNSELPVTPFSQQTDIRVMIEAMGGPEGLLLIKKQEPEMFEQLSAPFNYKPEVDLVDQVSTLCLQRMEQCKEGLQSGIDDPTMLVQNVRPPVSMYEPNHLEKQLWFSRWLDLQQGQEAPMELRQCAEQFWILHENMKTQKELPQAANQGLIAGTGQAAAAAPMALGQAALQGAQGGAEPSQGMEQQHEHIQNQHDREAEAASQLSEQQHSLREKELEGQIQLAVTREQGKNAKETAKIAGDNAVRTAKAKPRKPAAAA